MSDFPRQLAEIRERIAYTEATFRRTSVMLGIAFAGVGVCTFLSVFYTGTARGEMFGLFGAGFGLVLTLVVVAQSPVRPDASIANDPYVAQGYRTSRRLYRLSFVLVAYWVGMAVWRATDLWRLLR